MTETVPLSDDAYALLDARRREDESFGDVVVRLAGGRPLLDAAGTGHPDDGVADAIDDAREDLNRSTERMSEAFSDDS